MVRFVVLLGVSLLGAATLWGQVVINEVGWSGTQASGYDEWIELYNYTEGAVDLSGWKLLLGTREIALSGVIPPHGFFLLERTDDNTISNIEADQIYKGAMANAGVVLTLLDPEGKVVDTANQGIPKGWAAGSAKPPASMERLSPAIPDSPLAWRTGTAGEGRDAKGNPVYGSPKAPNAASSLLIPLKLRLPPGPLMGKVKLSWEAEGKEGLEVRIYLKAGEAWELLVGGLPLQGSFTWDTTAVPNGKAFLAVGVFDAGGSRGGEVAEVEIANP